MDHGVNAFQVITMTNIIQQVSEKITIKTEIPEKKPGDRRSFSETVGIKIVDKNLNQIVSQQPLLSSTWPLQKAWVLPEIPSYLPQLPVGSIDASVIRVTYVEPWMIDFSGPQGSDHPPSFQDLNTSYIANCVKAVRAEDSEFTKTLLKLGERGQGGLLGSIANTFADVTSMIAPPMIRMAGNVLDGFIPI